jgi:hypothetical protein
MYSQKGDIVNFVLRWLTRYFSLYSLVADACAKIMLWAAMYGSTVESPTVHFVIPKGSEQRPGAKSALS